MEGIGQRVRASALAAAAAAAASWLWVWRLRLLPPPPLRYESYSFSACHCFVLHVLCIAVSHWKLVVDNMFKRGRPVRCSICQNN